MRRSLYRKMFRIAAVVVAAVVVVVATNLAIILVEERPTLGWSITRWFGAK